MGSSNRVAALGRLHERLPPCACGRGNIVPSSGAALPENWSLAEVARTRGVAAEASQRWCPSPKGYFDMLPPLLAAAVLGEAITGAIAANRGWLRLRAGQVRRDLALRKVLDAQFVDPKRIYTHAAVVILTQDDRVYAKSSSELFTSPLSTATYTMDALEASVKQLFGVSCTGALSLVAESGFGGVLVFAVDALGDSDNNRISQTEQTWRLDEMLSPTNDPTTQTAGSLALAAWTASCRRAGGSDKLEPIRRLTEGQFELTPALGPIRVIDTHDLPLRWSSPAATEALGVLVPDRNKLFTYGMVRHQGGPREYVWQAAAAFGESLIADHEPKAETTTPWGNATAAAPDPDWSVRVLASTKPVHPLQAELEQIDAVVGANGDRLHSHLGNGSTCFYDGGRASVFDRIRAAMGARLFSTGTEKRQWVHEEMLRQLRIKFADERLSRLLLGTGDQPYSLHGATKAARDVPYTFGSRLCKTTSHPHARQGCPGV